MAECTEKYQKIKYYGKYYRLDGYSGSIYFQGVINDDATILQGFVVGLDGPFYSEEIDAEEETDLVPILNETAQTFPASRFTDGGKYQLVTERFEVFTNYKE